jgi:hypothetical protein
VKPALIRVWAAYFYSSLQLVDLCSSIYWFICLLLKVYSLFFLAARVCLLVFIVLYASVLVLSYFSRLIGRKIFFYTNNSYSTLDYYNLNFDTVVCIYLLCYTVYDFFYTRVFNARILCLSTPSINSLTIVLTHMHNNKKLATKTNAVAVLSLKVRWLYCVILFFFLNEHSKIKQTHFLKHSYWRLFGLNAFEVISLWTLYLHRFSSNACVSVLRKKKLGMLCVFWAFRRQNSKRGFKSVRKI